MSALAAYDAIIFGTSSDPYRIVVGVPEPTDVEARLREAGYRVENDDEVVVVQHDDLPGGSARLTWEESEGFSEPDGNDLSADDARALAAVRQKVGFEVMLTRDWRTDVQAVARLVQQALPEAVGMYDWGALSFWSPRWLRAVAAGRPLPLMELFEIHAVGDAGRLWAHTHGLRRLGLIELELHADLDEVPPESAGRIINAAAHAMAVGGVPPSDTPLRIGTDTTVEWEPWESLDVGADELGGADDRDEDHSVPSGVLYPSAAEPPLRPGLVFEDERGWAVPADGLHLFEEHARATAATAYEESRARPGRWMRASAGSVWGTVASFDGGVFTLEPDDGGEKTSAPLSAIDSWWVTCDEGYSLGPWKAHNLSVIEDVAARRRPTHDSEGRPLCTVCGKPLAEGHTH